MENIESRKGTITELPYPGNGYRYKINAGMDVIWMTGHGAPVGGRLGDKGVLLRERDPSGEEFWVWKRQP